MKTYILLVGSYEFRRHYFPFVNVAENRVSYLLSRNANWANDSSIEFVLFNPGRGEIRRNLILNGRRQYIPVDDFGDFEPVSRAHYQGSGLKQEETRLMSITDIYRYIRAIGEREPGTLLEVSIFGHAWMGGPVIFNSYERDTYKWGGSQTWARDPYDKDGRPKDFNQTNNSEEDFRSFQAAFRSDGYFWSWGCNNPKTYKRLLSKFLQQIGRRSLSDISDDETFRFSFEGSSSYEATWRERLGRFPSYFIPKINGVASLSFDMSFRKFKQFFKSGTLWSYHGLFAYNTGVTCIGGNVGTYSEYDQNQRPMLMLIPQGQSGQSGNFSKQIAFYRFLLDYSSLSNSENSPANWQEADRRGFGIFTPQRMREWMQELESQTL